MDLVGRTLGKFRITERIGRGSMSVCYKAENTVLGSTVALKVLAPELRKNPFYVSLFHEKAQVGAKLDHPNIVRIHDLVIQDEDLFVVMDYVEGRKLSDMVEQDGPLETLHGLRLLSGICDALAAAHASSVVHYNLKPHNIILEPDGNPVVIDIGNPVALFPYLLPGQDQLLGRIRYLSPEELRRDRVDFRTDLWSLGVTAFYLFTARFPFPAEDPEELKAQILSDRPPDPPTRFRPGLPLGVESLVLKLLRRDPADRHHSAVSVKQEVADILVAMPDTLDLAKADTAVVAGRGRDSHRPLSAIQRGMVGPYRLLERKGTGSFALVFMAEDQRSGRLVALKLLKSEFADSEEVIERFRQEAEFARRIHHPHVVRFYEFGVEENVPGRRDLYFTMEYVEGPRLKDLIQPGRPLPLPRCLEIARQIALGLQAAHDVGIIHRDLKPANVLLDKTGRVLIADFGIAVAHFVEHRLTATGQLLGTYAYMSPEQARGEVVTPASDLYSLGIILFEMLTGDAPFRFTDDSPLVMLRRIVEEEPPPFPAALSIPERVQQLDRQLLHKQPGARPQSAAQLARVLERLQMESAATKMPGPHSLNPVEES
ncbi:MAG: serine/threonine protein kinase [Planctomycetes bacterium]|nr:serine/threonine protein kinase [Planctomycetota bacterium]